MRVLEFGARKPSVLAGLRRRNGAGFSKVEFEQAIGQLFLAGCIKPVGKTSGRKIGLNTRRA